jgi:glycosyltransferase involved in cell wall biosynthesis
MAQLQENNGVGTRTKVMILIPALDVGGAETDLVRNLPLIERSQFELVVCAFLAQGNLAAPLRNAGIEIIGPIRLCKPRIFGWLTWMTSRARWLAATRRHAVGVARAIARRLPASLQRGARRMLALAGRVATTIVAAWVYLRMAAVVASHIRDRKIDIVHAILPNSYVIAAIACVLARRPTLIMSRVSLNWYQDWTFRAIERHLLHRLVDLVICNSSAIRQDLLAEGLPAAKLRLIPNGIDAEEFFPPGSDRRQLRDALGLAYDALVLTQVANLHPYKGHADLLHAMRLVRSHLPSGWILLIAGHDVDGNLERLHRLTDQLGLESHINFLGERPDVAIILRAADIHLSASHTEGFPNNILEAMSTGLPVIATAVGGVPEMVVDGVTGILVPAHSPYEIAGALRSLVKDPDRRRSLGNAGRARAISMFSIDRSARALQQSYASLAGRPSAPSGC